MLYEELADPAATSPAELRREYERELASVVESVGAETVAERTDLGRERAESLAAGEGPRVTVEEAAAVLALSDEWPDAETIVLETRDHVMLQMSSAIVDVDALEGALDGDLDARALQQKIEGRQPMTLEEYARIHHHLASENPY